MNFVFPEKPQASYLKLGETITIKRLKTLATQYRLVLVIWGEIHIVTDPLRFNNSHIYPRGSYRVEDIDTRGQWIELRYLPPDNVPLLMGESSVNEIGLNLKQNSA
ncbi:MAG: hypothetical protein ACFFE8_09455 [Candidatus Heimdallarchaeota archaeon]